MVAFHLAKVVHMVLFQEHVDVVGRDLAKTRSVQALESSPRLESVLMGELLSLFLNDLFVLADGFQQQVDFESR